MVEIGSAQLDMSDGTLVRVLQCERLLFFYICLGHHLRGILMLLVLCDSAEHRNARLLANGGSLHLLCGYDEMLRNVILNVGGKKHQCSIEDALIYFIVISVAILLFNRDLSRNAYSKPNGWMNVGLLLNPASG